MTKTQQIIDKENKILEKENILIVIAVITMVLELPSAIYYIIYLLKTL